MPGCACTGEDGVGEAAGGDVVGDEGGGGDDVGPRWGNRTVVVLGRL